MARRYAIIGTGALGGLYGARLQQAGRDVHFLVHRDLEHVRRHGLRVESIWGDLVLERVSAWGRPQELPPCDVVCVCLKTTQNHLLPDLLGPLVRPGTIVLLMQNGLGAEEEVAALFPRAEVGGGLCYLCSNKVGPGHIRHLDYGRVTFGAHTPGLGAYLPEIAADFAAAGVPVDITPDLAMARWQKLCWNVPYNGLSVVLEADTSAIMADPATCQLAADLMRDIIAGAAACGHTIAEGYVEQMLAFTARMRPYSPSMKLDYLARRPLEIDSIYDRPARLARAAGRPLPYVETLAAQLHFLDTRNRRAAAPSDTSDRSDPSDEPQPPPEPRSRS